jgi:predicted DNA-binding transcriptional regulator YafY
VCKAGTWYLVAASGGEPRTYRVSRIAEATVRPDDAAGRPARFELASWWDRSAAAFDATIRPLAVRLRVGPEALGALPRAVPGPATEAALVARSAPDVDGRCTVALAMEPLEVAVHQLAPLAGVEVLDPPELRTALADHARRVLAANG